MDFEAKHRFRAKTALNAIIRYLSNKQGSIENGEFLFCGFGNPQELYDKIIDLTSKYIAELNELSDLISVDEFGFLKQNAARKVSNVYIKGHVKNYAKWTTEENKLYKEFIKVQGKSRRIFLKYIEREFDDKVISQKFTWLGNQRQLVELFDELIIKGWIKEDASSQKQQCLPIIRAFAIRDENGIDILDEATFAKQWQNKLNISKKDKQDIGLMKFESPNQRMAHNKPPRTHYRNPPDYIQIFDRLPDNE